MRNKKGITLLEVVVTMAVFAVAITLAVDLFLTVSSLQRRSVKLQEAEYDAQSILEIVARNARNMQFDYEFYNFYKENIDPNFSFKNTHILALRPNGNADFSQVIIRRSSQNASLSPWAGDGDDIEFCSANFIENNETDIPCQQTGAAWQSYDSDKTLVKNFKFYISPDASSSSSQEIMTVFLAVESRESKKGEAAAISLQTAFSLNVYK